MAARWPDAAISYEVAEPPANAPADLAAALDRAFDRWRAADCGGGRHPGLAFARRAAAAPGASRTPRGQAGFSDEPPAVTRGTLSVTRLHIAPDTGEILRARMVFHANALRPYGEGAFFDSIALHEAGHFLGLAHSADPSAAMFAGVYDGLEPRVTLGADDVAAICDAYPPRGITAAAAWWRSASGVAMLLVAAAAVAATCAVLRRTSFGARLSARR